MRIVFLGTPDAVLAPLTWLLDEAGKAGHELVAVVSQPARPVGRHGTPTDPPVAAQAKARGVRVLQPEKASDPAFLAALRDLAPDVAITAAYGQILTDAFLAIPKRATINIHPSMLPRYRGATPVTAALLDGLVETGVSVLFTVKKLDAGNIIAQEKLPVAADETTGALTLRGFELGARMLPGALAQLADPAFTGTAQDDAKVTLCRKVDKGDGIVDWKRSAETIYNRFRAFEPWPGTFTFLAGKRVALTKLRYDARDLASLAPGEVTFDKKMHALRVGTDDGTIQVVELRPAGGKDQNAAAFWNGLKDRTRVFFTADESAPGAGKAP